MKFAEFHAGQVIEGGPFHLTEDEVLRFATTYDPQWFHTNPEAAAQGPFGGLIASVEEGKRANVPGTNKIPLLGGLIGSTEKGARLTELIVFITPKIIRNGEEAASESQELRDKMKNLTFN